MDGLTRRRFITGSSAAAGAVAAGFSVKVPTFSNSPAKHGEIPRLEKVAFASPTDTSQEPVNSHVGDNFTEAIVSLESRDLLGEFEFYFEFDSRSFGRGNIPPSSAKFCIYFYDSPDLENRLWQSIEITPQVGNAFSGQYIDKEKPSEYSNWTIDSFIESDDDFAPPDRSQTGLVKVYGKRTANGYDMTFSWEAVWEEPNEQGIPEQKREPKTATYKLPLPNIYGLAASFRDERDFRGDSERSSVFPFNTTMHNLVQVDGLIAVTKMNDGSGSGLDPIDCTIQRSCGIFNARYNLGKPTPSSDPEFIHVMLVEPNASVFEINEDVSVEKVGEDYGYPRLEVIAVEEGERVSLFPGVNLDYARNPNGTIKSFEKKFDKPFAFSATLGEFTIVNDFANTIAVVKSTRELTWVAPTLHELARVKDLLQATQAVEGLRDKFPEVEYAGAKARLTPIELLAGSVDLSKFDFYVYQEHQEGTGDDIKYFVDAKMVIMGDDLFKGKMRLTDDFDLSKPINILASDTSLDREVRFVDRPYPVIDLSSIVNCTPPPQLLV